MIQRVYPQKFRLGGDSGMIFPDIFQNNGGMLGIMEGFLRDPRALGNAAGAVVIVVKWLVAEDGPVGFQRQPVGHRDILAGFSLGVADAVKQFPAVELVAGAGIAVIPQEDSARQFLAADPLLPLWAQAHSLLARAAVHIIAPGAHNLGIAFLHQGEHFPIHFRFNPVVAVHKADVFA